MLSKHLISTLYEIKQIQIYKPKGINALKPTTMHK